MLSFIVKITLALNGLVHKVNRFASAGLSKQHRQGGSDKSTKYSEKFDRFCSSKMNQTNNYKKKILKPSSTKECSALTVVHDWSSWCCCLVLVPLCYPKVDDEVDGAEQGEQPEEVVKVAPVEVIRDPSEAAVSGGDGCPLSR